MVVVVVLGGVVLGVVSSVVVVVVGVGVAGGAGGVGVGVPVPAAGAVVPVPTAVRVPVRMGPALGGEELPLATLFTGETPVPPPEGCALPWA